MMTRNAYNAIVAEVEKMALLIMNNDVVAKVKYVEADDRKYRVAFWWDFSLKKLVVKVEEKKYVYKELLVWDRAETEKTFPEYFMDYIKEDIKYNINSLVKVFASLIEDADEEKVKNLYEQEYKNKAEYTGFTVEEIKNMVCVAQ